MNLADELAALADKYEVLARLRARREQVQAAGGVGFDDGEAEARKLAFRELGRAFPGALRELDVTPAAVFRGKRDAVLEELERVRAGAAAPARPWVLIVLDFHALLRELLAVKLFLARDLGGAPIDDDAVDACRAHVARRPASRFPWPVSRESLEQARRPPRGRVMPLVWATLEARHGLAPRALEAAVFGVPEGESGPGSIRP